MFNIENLVRENIRNLSPYSSARDEYKGEAGIFLDANENSFGSASDELHNRYPDPLALELKAQLGLIKDVKASQIFLGNGSDEAIDLLFRIFCNPAKDNVIILPPTYGMYSVSAHINDVKVINVNLKADFILDVDGILNAINENTKLIFLCCPNNPSGTSFKEGEMKTILKNFNGIVVLDEAYIDYSSSKSFISELGNYPNLVILQTFSKAWGMANLRLGIAYASKTIIGLLNKVKSPYNINGLTQQLALKALNNKDRVKTWIDIIIIEREKLIIELLKLPFVIKVYPSEANFILVKMRESGKMYDYLIANKIIVRDRSNVILCEGCLRITIGTEKENSGLIKILKQF